MKTVAIMGGKGGTGRTMLTAQLARAVSRSGKGRAVVLDLSPAGDAVAWAKDGDAPLLALAATPERVASHPLYTKSRCTHVFVDHPAGSIGGTVRADMILLPFRPSLPDIRALLHFHEKLLHAARPMLAVCNAARAGTSEAREALEFLAESVQLQCAASVLHDRVLFRRTFAAGKGVADIGSKSRAKEEIFALYQELNL